MHDNKQAELGELSASSDILCYTRNSPDVTLFYKGTSKSGSAVDKFLVSLILFTSSVVIGDRKARNELKRKFYI